MNMGLLSEKFFFCPYCGSANSIRLDNTEGTPYKLVVDCEICCRPIAIQVKMINHEYELDVRGENE